MAVSTSKKVRKGIGALVIYALVFISIWACEKEEDFVSNDPSTYIFFLNRDSLDQVGPIIDSLKAEQVGYDTVIANYNSSADILADSLLKYAALVNSGQTEYSDQVTIFQNQLDALNTELEGIKKEDSAVNAQQSKWSSVATVINSGSLKLSMIENLKNGLTVSYEDSSSTWKLPLDMHSDDVQLALTIVDQVYHLTVEYNRSTITDEKNRVLIRTSDFGVISTDFDSVHVSCSDCEDYETTIYVEF